MTSRAAFQSQPPRDSVNLASFAEEVEVIN